MYQIPAVPERFVKTGNFQNPAMKIRQKTQEDTVNKVAKLVYVPQVVIYQKFSP